MITETAIEHQTSLVLNKSIMLHEGYIWCVPLLYVILQNNHFSLGFVENGIKDGKTASRWNIS